MRKQQFEEAMEKRRKRKEAIRAFFRFPLTVAAKYRFLIKGFSDIEARWAETNEKMTAYKKAYKKLVEYFIMAPLYFGVLFGVGSALQVGYAGTQVSWKNYYKKDLKKKVYRIHNAKIPFLNIEKAGSRLVERLEKKGGKPYLLLTIPIFFVMSFGGALILSRNPIFSQTDKIKKTLQDFKMTDGNGEAWEFVYTPDLIMFNSYGIVADEFIRKRNFWTTINFSPQPARISPDDQNVFLVKRKTQMPLAVLWGNFTTLPTLDELLEMTDDDTHSPDIMVPEASKTKVAEKDVAELSEDQVLEDEEEEK